MNQTSSQNSPKIFFLYLFVTVALFVSVYSFLAVTDQIIDRLVPMGANLTAIPMGYIYGLQNYVASLIVAFPALFYASFILIRENNLHPEHNAQLKKWFCYFLIFLAGITVFFKLISVLQSFLSDEFTLRFLCKTLMTCAVMIFTAYFYFGSLNQQWRPVNLKLFSILLSVIVLVVIAYGICIIKSTPKTILGVGGITNFPAIVPPIAAKDLPYPTKSLPYCKKTLKITSQEDEVVQKLIAKFAKNYNCSVGDNCLLKWDDHGQNKFSIAWKKGCNIGDGSTFVCNKTGKKLSCSPLGFGEAVYSE
jgi:hypothetical protein